MNRRQEALCKRLRRQAVEGSREYAQKCPRAFGRMLRARGYYAPTVKEADLESHVNKILLRIEREGCIFPHRQLDEMRILKYPEEKQSRRSAEEKVQGFGFLDAEVPENADRPYSTAERHQLYELLFTLYGDKKTVLARVAQKMGRHVKAISRQFQEALYNERTKASVEYTPDLKYRTQMTRDRLNVFGVELIKKNPVHKVALEFTSRLLCFLDKDELLRTQRHLNQVPKMRRPRL